MNAPDLEHQCERYARIKLWLSAIEFLVLLGTLVGGLSWHLVERPAMRLARSMPAGRRQAGPMTPDPVPSQPHPLTS